MGSQVWSTYRPANVRGFEGPSSFIGVAHANTGGVTAGLEPLPTGGTTTAFGTLGVAADPASPNAQMAKILTALIQRQAIDILRDKAVIMSEGSYLKARHVPGTNIFRYKFFADLGVAEDLLEGIPPEPEGLAWDTFEFGGGQKGKLVRVTDVAELFASEDLRSIAAEKLAWNAIDTAEIQAVAMLTAATGVAVTVEDDAPAANIIATVVALKKGDVPAFGGDGTYKALISPADAAFIMTETGELGWTEASKYQDSVKLMAGELGKFRGVRFVESNRITDHKTIVFGPDAWVWGDYQTIKPYFVAPGGDHADPLAQQALLGWKGFWGMDLVEFDGTPAAGPASNTHGFRFATVDLTGTA